MAQLAASNDVTLEAVESSERHWNYKSQGLTTLAAAVIAVAVAAATAGSSLGASLAGVSSTTATGAAANAGMASLISQAAVSLIDNQGNIGKTLTQLGSLNTVKAMALSMAEAGAFSEIGSLTNGHFTAAGVTRNGGLTPMRYLASGQGLENVLGHAAVGCAAGMASGGSCGSNAAAAALSDAASPLTIDAGFAGGTALAASIGAGTSAITGGSAAIGAITGAEGYLYNDMAGDLEELGGGVPRLVPTPKGATQFIFPNGMILRFDLSPGQYLSGQGPHINLEYNGINNHIDLGE